jgi:hypothetical protein
MFRVALRLTVIQRADTLANKREYGRNSGLVWVPVWVRAVLLRRSDTRYSTLGIWDAFALADRLAQFSVGHVERGPPVLTLVPRQEAGA